VEGAERYNCRFVERTPESVTVTTCRGTRETYQVLNVIEFTSTRKRMSVVVRTPAGEIKLLTKGADSVILERLGPAAGQRRHHAATVSHLEAFATEGLRTLCLAERIVAPDDYEEWSRRYVQAAAAVTDREVRVEEVANQLETDLTLIGATAIEDKLQEQVPETIEKLLEANIHVWMLTGDKQETAINIAKSCRLHRDGTEMFIVNATSEEEAQAEVAGQLDELRTAGVVGQSNNITLVTDGKSLEYLLKPDQRKDFIELCTSCRAVVCCRVSPIQKAEMVELVKEHTKAITLSIGDGANDVAMIQKASVGVGISGNEGLQAANSADFAIAQFRFLGRLLFVHGAWNYSRISKVILYSFYKNITLYIIELWFAIYNYWSGQVIYERWTIGMYNVFFTSAPPVALGLFDRSCSAETREKYPSLYHSTQKSELFNHREFWKWIGNAIFHSILLFWLPKLAMSTGVSWPGGQTDGYLVLGNTVYTLVVVTTCLKAGIEMDAWTWFSHASIWGSIGLWILFLVVYSSLWPTVNLASNMPGMAAAMLGSGVFWASLVLVPTVTLLADVAFRAGKTTVFTTETDRIRIAEIVKREVANTKILIHKYTNRWRPTWRAPSTARSPSPPACSGTSGSGSSGTGSGPSSSHRRSWTSRTATPSHRRRRGPCPRRSTSGATTPPSGRAPPDSRRPSGAPPSQWGAAGVGAGPRRRTPSDHRTWDTFIVCIPCCWSGAAGPLRVPV
jgi:phospholipid-transporting ATPase